MFSQCHRLLAILAALRRPRSHVDAAAVSRGPWTRRGRSPWGAVAISPGVVSQLDGAPRERPVSTKGERVETNPWAQPWLTVGGASVAPIASEHKCASAHGGQLLQQSFVWR